MLHVARKQGLKAFDDLPRVQHTDVGHALDVEQLVQAQLRIGDVAGAGEVFGEEFGAPRHRALVHKVDGGQIGRALLELVQLFHAVFAEQAPQMAEKMQDDHLFAADQGW